MMEQRTGRLLLREFVEEDWRAVLAYQYAPAFARTPSLEPRTANNLLSPQSFSLSPRTGGA